MFVKLGIQLVRQGCGLLATLVLGCMWPALQAAPPNGNDKCLACHNSPEITAERNGKEVSVFVHAEKFGNSAHKAQACRDCHTDLSQKHPNDGVRPKPVSCAPCHQTQVKDHVSSVHGAIKSPGTAPTVECKDCHGIHDIAPIARADSPVSKKNLPMTCSKCHPNAGAPTLDKASAVAAGARYMDSIHSAVQKADRISALPDCKDCHGYHDVKRKTDAEATVSRANVVQTCAQCHPKQEKLFSKSIHGTFLAKGDMRAPSCVQCHRVHQTKPAVGGALSTKRQADQICGSCHQDRLTRYRDTYHGKAMALGAANAARQVASCNDCHGHHSVFKVADDRSTLAAGNIVQTCQKCHPNANVNFTKYAPHADPLDRKNYPLLFIVFWAMTGLLVGTFTFFGAHTLMWFLRSLWVYRHDPKKFLELKRSTQADKTQFTRFKPFERFLHYLVVTSFLLLVITGMPLKFYYTGWAHAIFKVLGGTESARALHHFAAVITFLYFALHLGSLAIRLWKKRSLVQDPETGRWSLKLLWQAIIHPDSMVPTLKDWKDFVAHTKWFFKKGPKPQFDRWTYWEKFDYLAVFWGVAIIGLSGLILWFPVFFSRFLPGWVINVAMIVHSDEALLAAGFIFTIHFFNTHFRPEKFPMDTVIFSGRISKSELLHERQPWYDRLNADGKLDELAAQELPRRWQGVIKFFGYAFLGVGLLMLLLIIYAMSSHFLFA